MRILQLRFKNLNSLAGEWKIDFTNPAYISSGIFAITGPTGSGKTTILDAICLALYGQTPRLKTISRSTNEIMSRNTGECFAEVVFESQKGKFTCHWSQRRAHARPEGDLQQPKHEISDSSGKVLENRIAKVLERVIETTGLDFSQFTRSIMLAQGDFAAFLNANPDERAPILEKITGTAIYAEISRKVHERTSLETDKRRDLTLKIGSINVLPPDKVEELKQDYELAEAEVRKRVSDRDTHKVAIEWMQNISRLEEELADLNERKKVTAEKRSRSAGDLASLSRSRRTLPFEEPYSRLGSTRELVRRYKEEIKENVTRLDEIATAYTTSEGEFEAARLKLESVKEATEKERSILTQVRDLDIRVRENDRQTAEKRDELDTLHDKILQYQGIIETSEQELLEKTSLLEKTVSYLAEHAPDRQLTEHLSGLEERISNYNRLTGTIATDRQLLESQKKELPALHEALSDKRKLLSEKEKIHDDAREEVKKARSMYDQMLNGREPGFWRECTISLRDRKDRLESEQKIHESVQKLEEKIGALHKERALLVEDLGQKQQVLAGLKHEQSLEEEIVAKIETNLELLCRIESLEGERSRLADGIPCPLCGSTEHPYSRGNVPGPDEVKSEWTSHKENLQDLLGKIRLQEDSIVRLEADVHLGQTTEQEWKDQVRELLKESGMGIEDPGSAAGSRDIKEIIRRALLLCDIHYGWCSEVAGLADSLEKRLSEAFKAEAAAKEGLAGVRTDYRDLEVEVKEKEKDIAGLEDRIAASESERERSQLILIDDLQNYGIDFRAGPPPGGIVRTLKQRRRDFEEALNHERDLAKERALIVKDLENLRKKVEEDRKSGAALLQIIGKKEEMTEELLSQRSDMYGTKDPDVEEKKLAEYLNTVEANFLSASDKKKEYGARVASLREQISRTTEKLAEDEGIQRDLESQFSGNLRGAGFLDEEDFISARLPPERMDALERLEKELFLEERAISSRMEEITRILEQERSRGVSDRTLEDLEKEILADEEAITDLNQTLGRIGQRLKEQEELTVLQKDLNRSLDQQEAECLRWEKLHVLIGSSDGKKFRVFAQGLTFDRLIAHANVHLRSMSDRYLLIRRENSTLELDIMDNYQAGETRSTKNLSGGESFIVSLALALGLSGMASHNVQIDSLFLDEGFGTLDNDTLEIALETLSTLQEEGKIIGIISHVQELQERIPTKIEVEKLSGGRSRLRAPGCTSSGTM